MTRARILCQVYQTDTPIPQPGPWGRQDRGTRASILPGYIFTEALLGILVRRSADTRFGRRSCMVVRGGVGMTGTT